MTDIALMGRAGSGKDTAAAALSARFGHVRIAFADPLREMALAADPIIDVRDSYDSPEPVTYRLSDAVNGLGWDTAKRTYPEVRRFLQRLGLEAVRGTLGADTWVRVARQRIDAVRLAGWPVAVTDVRFPNEVATLRELGFRLVWIDRPGVADGGHASENAVGPEDADAIVTNDNTPDALYARIAAAVVAHV